MARLGVVTHIANHASFDQRNYGFKKLSEMFAAIDLFEMKKTDNTVFWVRDKKEPEVKLILGQNNNKIYI